MGIKKGILPILVASPLLSNAQEKPNVLWLTFEDTSPQFIGCYGNKDVKTPNIDKLASEGVKFINAFSNGTVCAPSRSTIITGCRTEAIGTGNHRSYYPIPDYIKGFPSYIKEAGYYTSNNSKTDYNTSNARDIINNSWYESSGKAGWWKKEEGQPFFSVFNNNNSHQSRTMTNPYKWYEEKILGRLDSSEITYTITEMPAFYHDTPEMRKHFLRVHNSLNLTDKQIGDLIKRLENDGLKDETIIFCYADHGEGIPKGKTNPVGFGYRVPFIIWFPDKYKHLSPWEIGKETDELVCFEDLAPTMLSLLDLEIPDYMKGRPFLGKQRKEPVNYIFGSRNRLDESPDVARSVTNGRYMYTRVFQPYYPPAKYQKYSDVSDILTIIRKEHKEGKLNKAQAELVEPRPIEYLYDLHEDKWEVDNLAFKPEFENKLKEMREVLFNDIINIKDILFLPEYEIAEISKNTTAYEYRDEDEFYINNIVETAYLVGQGKDVIEEQIKLLNDDNKFVRYWAAIGLHAQGEEITKHKKDILNALDDKYPCVKIEMAGLAYKYFNSQEAKTILELYARNENYHLSLQALQTIEYLEEKAADFEQVLRDILANFKSLEAKEKKQFYNHICCIELTFHNLYGEPIYYDHMKKYLDFEVE